jgi:glycerophosphoryl diester phosphodiesterase
MAEKRPLVIAHRGSSALAPENTMAAFARAMRDGADGIELDVRLAGDGVPVVIHDPVLRRTGLRAGSVAKLSSIELARIDVGRWFKGARTELSIKEDATQSIPTLEQVFQFLEQHKRATVYLELKTDQAESSAGELARSVVELIKRHQLEKRVVIVSFNLDLIEQVKRNDAAIVTGALFEPKRQMARLALKRRMIEAAMARGADEILLHYLVTTEGATRFARDNNLRVVVWTIDDPRWLRRAARLGIHALITNNPAAFIGLP